MSFDDQVMAPKIGYLDSLRGIAAFVVVLYHFAFSFYPAILGIGGSNYVLGFESLIYATPINVLLNGRFAVFVFFVLSGYVLTYRFFATGDQSILRSGAVRRYFRLLPPVLVSLLCTFIVIVAFSGYINAMFGMTGNDHLKSYFEQPPDLLNILRQAFWGSFFDGSVAYNQVLWTMGVEFIGSMLVFGMAALIGKTPNRWVFYLVAGLFLLNTYYLPFVLGMLLADIYNGERRGDFAIGTGPILLFVLGVGLFLGSFSDIRSYDEIFNYLVIGQLVNPDMFFHSVGAFLLLMALLNSPRLQALMSCKPLVFLGKISFSMYLMHEIVFGTFATVLFLVLLNIIHLSYFTALAIALPLSLIVVLGVSWLIYKYIDSNGIELSKTIYETYFTVGQRPEPPSPEVNAVDRPSSLSERSSSGIR